MPRIRTWDDDVRAAGAVSGLAADFPAARTVDRDPHRARRQPGGQPGDEVPPSGPLPRCCARRLVAADMLARVPDALVPALRARFPQFSGTGPYYLCDGCLTLVVRAGLAAANAFVEAGLE